MTAGHLHVSYIVTNPCIVSGTTRVSVKTNKVISISNLAAILDF